MNERHVYRQWSEKWHGNVLCGVAARKVECNAVSRAGVQWKWQWSTYKQWQVDEVSNCMKWNGSHCNGTTANPDTVCSLRRQERPAVNVRFVENESQRSGQQWYTGRWGNGQQVPYAAAR